MKDMLKYTTMELGELFVMIIGATQMAMWCVGCWGTE